MLPSSVRLIISCPTMSRRRMAGSPNRCSAFSRSLIWRSFSGVSAGSRDHITQRHNRCWLTLDGQLTSLPSTSKWRAVRSTIR